MWQQNTTPNIKHYTIVFYLYEGWLVAQGPPSGKQPWGLGHRSADWACSGDGALSATAPGTHWAGVLCTAGQRYYVQTLVPGKCMCYPPGSSDMPPPGTQRKGRKRKKMKNMQSWKHSIISKYFQRDTVLSLMPFYICDIKPHISSSTKFRIWLYPPQSTQKGWSSKGVMTDHLR